MGTKGGPSRVRCTRVEALKAGLAQGRATCPLFDTARFTRHLESAYHTMWQRHQAGEPPASFAVERIIPAPQ
jgi:protein O-GlcNAc transferase